MQMGSNIETSAPDVSDMVPLNLYSCDIVISHQGIPLIDYEECLVERKWWCFLLSSIFTFVLGLISVIATRMVQTYLCIGVCMSDEYLALCLTIYISSGRC